MSLSILLVGLQVTELSDDGESEMRRFFRCVFHTFLISLSVLPGNLDAMIDHLYVRINSIIKNLIQKYNNYIVRHAKKVMDGCMHACKYLFPRR